VTRVVTNRKNLIHREIWQKLQQHVNKKENKFLKETLRCYGLTNSSAATSFCVTSEANNMRKLLQDLTFSDKIMLVGLKENKRQ